MYVWLGGNDMVKRLAALLDVVLCLVSASACGAPVTLAQDVSIIGEWVRADDPEAVLLFDDSSICTQENGEQAKYKFRVDFNMLQIFGQTQNIGYRQFEVILENGIYMLRGVNTDQILVRAEDLAATQAYLQGLADVSANS
jgi:hypothetical protein